MGRGQRGGGGGRRGGGGRGGGRGGKSNKAPLSKREISHLQQFGENHPSKEMKEFGGGESSAKRFKFGGSSRGRGGFRGSYGGRPGRNNRAERVSSSESEEEEVTPYNELLSLFTKAKGLKKEVQIVSEEEEEEEDDEVLEEVEETAAEEVDIEEGDSSEGSDDEEEGSGVGEGEDPKPILKKRGSKKSAEESEDEDKDTEVVAVGKETVIEETEIDPEMEDAGKEERNIHADPFLLHFEREMSDKLQTILKSEKPNRVKVQGTWPILDRFVYLGLDTTLANETDVKGKSLSVDLSALGRAKPIHVPDAPTVPLMNRKLESYSIKQQFFQTLPVTNQAILDKEAGTQPLTNLQMEFLHLFSQYYDVYYPSRTLENDDALRIAYCLHVANHVLKTRTRILHHNAKMVNKVDVPESYRDQGFVRPKVLILVPFKDSALKIVKVLVSLFLLEEKGNVANKKRFEDEYSGSNIFLPKTNPKPEDYNATFGGNVEDNFKMGLSLTKKTVKLYSDFYSSDIIIASPLGLRLIIGAEGEKSRDFDFLSSIELLVMDQADIFLMQNWDHVLHLMKHLNLQPTTTHGTDFARIRPWALDGLTNYYRQTLVFSSINCPELSSLMSRYCPNFAGQLRCLSLYEKGSICQVTVQLPQVFQYFECDSLQEEDDARFDFFIKKVLPNFSEKLMSHTLIFVSSYFDFVRLRNHFKREQSSFVQICEYTKDKKIARARDYFYHGQSHFVLYTERVHFFRRLTLKGIGHVIFYQLPQYPHFYSELCNFIREDFQNRRVRLRKNSSVNVIYCKYDTLRLTAIVGSDRASHMLSSDKKVHAFVSGEL